LENILEAPQYEIIKEKLSTTQKIRECGVSNFLHVCQQHQHKLLTPAENARPLLGTGAQIKFQVHVCRKLVVLLWLMIHRPHRETAVCTWYSAATHTITLELN
jgi:hypothetical protein